MLIGQPLPKIDLPAITLKPIIIDIDPCMAMVRYYVLLKMSIAYIYKCHIGYIF